LSPSPRSSPFSTLTQADIAAAFRLNYHPPDNSNGSAPLLFSLSNAFRLCPERGALPLGQDTGAPRLHLGDDVGGYQANPAGAGVRRARRGLICNGNFLARDLLLPELRFAFVSVGAMGVNHVATSHTTADRLRSAAEAEKDREAKESYLRRLCRLD
jgi:hypothetical protein